MRYLRERLGGDGGFSLIELLVTMLVMGVVASAIGSVVTSMMRSQTRSFEVSDVLAEARAGLIRTQNELREAKRIYPGTGPASPACDADSLELWVDRDRNGLVEAVEHVYFEVVADGPTWRLERWTAAQPTVRRVIARGLSTPDVFSCAPDPPHTRVIELDIRISGRGGHHDTDLPGSVRLRNVD